MTTTVTTAHGNCQGCGQYVVIDVPPDGHARTEHSPHCDGYTCASDCPTQVLCGPIHRTETPAERQISRLAAAVKKARGDDPAEIESSIRFLNKASSVLRGGCWASTTGEQCPDRKVCDDRGCQLYADEPVTDTRDAASGTGALPMPTNVESVAWAEEADRLANALWDLVHMIEADDLIPETVSYMRQAREVLQRWPTRQETEEAKERIWNRIQAQLNRQ